MQRSIQKNGLINLLALLAVGVAAFAVSRYANSLAGLVAAVFMGLGILVAAVSWFQMRLEERERLERMELEELARTHGGAALFEAKEAEVFPAQRSREQFERFFVPAFTVLLFLLQAGGTYLLWRWLPRNVATAEVKEPIAGLALFGLFALVLFLLGRFSATVARLEHHRLLRPGASYMLANAFFSFIVMLGLIGVWSGYRGADLFIAYFFCALLALMAVETLLQLVLEVYRPRVKGKVERPLYESRLIGLLGQPEGLITTAAQALDYQFGFKVSETWFYRFFEKALGWLILLQLAALLLSTCVVFIEAGEQGLLEHFGKPVTGRTPLGPGAHLKWPWPIDHVYRYPTELIQTFDVGFTNEEGRAREPVVLWTVAHTKEESDFIVANRAETSTVTTNQATGKRTPPVSLLNVSVPVSFQITNLLDWAYNNEAAKSLLQDLATHAVVQYLASADMNEVMSHTRLEMAQVLANRIQAAADERKMGAQIVSIDLEDLHPPVKIAAEYEKVVSAIQQKQAKIVSAQGDAFRTNALAGAEAVSIVNEAIVESTARQIEARAQAALFTNQIPAFQAAPSVFAERAKMEMLVRGTPNARKYVLLTTNTHDVLQFDLQESIAQSMLSLSVTSPPAPRSSP
jgi:regulator of protease activity HflC (stomatin/prohibitin superfamily)